VLFWNFRISFSANVPGLYRRFTFFSPSPPVGLWEKRQSRKKQSVATEQSVFKVRKTRLPVARDIPKNRAKNRTRERWTSSA
jgi:hypothetical protein